MQWCSLKYGRMWRADRWLGSLREDRTASLGVLVSALSNESGGKFSELTSDFLRQG